MKLAILKLCALLILALGIALILLGLQSNIIEPYMPRVGLSAETGTYRLIYLVTGAVFTVLGFYGLLPRLRRRRTGTISFKTDEGEVELQLENIERTLNRVISNTPEVKRCNIRVKPDAESSRAIIKAEVLLNRSSDKSARETARIVSNNITRTARNELGLEDLVTVDMTVTGIAVDAKRTSRALRTAPPPDFGETPTAEWTPPAQITHQPEEQTEHPHHEPVHLSHEDLSAVEPIEDTPSTVTPPAPVHDEYEEMEAIEAPEEESLADELARREQSVEPVAYDSRENELPPFEETATEDSASEGPSAEEAEKGIFVSGAEPGFVSTEETSFDRLDIDQDERAESEEDEKKD